jgi:hypothetical protein
METAVLFPAAISFSGFVSLYRDAAEMGRLDKERYRCRDT